MSNPYQSAEYQRFGPWIDRVDTLADVPRLFLDHPLDLAATRLLLKVPRNIPRRDATPDMDLYDRLLIVDDATLTVLTRNGHDAPAKRAAAAPRGFTETRLALDDVVALEDSVNLLRGTYRIHARDGRGIDFAFSGSARASLGALTTEMRSRFAPVAPPRPGSPADLSALEPAGDLALASDLRDVAAAHPGVAPRACHGRRALAPAATGARGVFARVSHAWSPMVLQGMIVAGDDAALEILGRHEQLTRGSAPVHSASRLTVARAAIETATVEELPGYRGGSTVTLTAGAWSATLPVPDGSETLEALTATAPARGGIVKR